MAITETPLHIVSVTEHEGIAEQLSDKYSTLYNSVPTDMDELTSIKEKIKHVLCRYNGRKYIVMIKTKCNEYGKIKD